MTVPGPVDDAMLAATAAWTAILDQVDGSLIDSAAHAAWVVRTVTDAVLPLDARQLRTFAVLVATNLLAAGEFVHADPQFLRHLLNRAVGHTPTATTPEDQT